MSTANDPETIRRMAADPELRRLARELVARTVPYRWSHNFTWLGRPVIQFPPDLVAVQQLIFSVKPDIVIETGIAHGGSLILSASILELIGQPADVVGVDIDIRPHNRAAIEEHPLSKRIRLIEGSSIAPGVILQVFAAAAGKKRPLVLLDSMHTHDHVLRELELYSPLVKAGSYLVAMDTIIEDLPRELYPDRPWGPGNSPKTAVHAFLARNDRFAIDSDFEASLLITASPDGFLRCQRD